MAPQSPLPQIYLLCMEEHFIPAFQKASEALGAPELSCIAMHTGVMGELPAGVKFDLVVSPANSYARLDGGFDEAISWYFSPKGELMELTYVAQARLYQEWRGFAPPGSCTLVRIPDEFTPRSRNVWNTRYVALCPTMRTPQEISWDREVVYESIWSLLCTVDKHNEQAEEHDKIQSLLMVPMGTGIGAISPERWANQLVLALKHFADAKANKDKWMRLRPSDIFGYSNELVDTWSM